MDASRNEPEFMVRLDPPNTGPAAKSASLDQGTATVLRALQEAKGAAAREAAIGSMPVADLANQLLALRGVLASCSPAVRDAEQSLIGRARVLEGALAALTDKLTESQRREDRAVQELRNSVQALGREADSLAAWHARTARRAAAWGAFLAILASAGIGLGWRAHQTARRTQAVLEQILENQTQAQAEVRARREPSARAKRP
jgi:hypothetical protein